MATARRVNFDCQCVPISQKCDNMVQCVSKADELKCDERILVKNGISNSVNTEMYIERHSRTNLLKAYRKRQQTALNDAYFKCPSSSPNIYLPIYLRCNQVYDCPEREDEADCDDYTCPGYYRCRNSPICVHADHVCDHIYGQCPQNDDELLCGFSCPLVCQCFGMAFYCNQSVDVSEYQDLRFLNADGSNMTLMDLGDNTMLIHVSLAICALVQFQVPRLPNLRSLDLRDNSITSLWSGSFSNVTNLQVLVLAGNPIDVDHSFPTLSECTSLRVLNLSRVRIDRIDLNPLHTLSHLSQLNLSNSGVNEVQTSGFQVLPSLRSLDLSGCPVTKFPPDVFQNLRKLRSLAASNYKLCCSVVLPKGFHPQGCQAPKYAFSSCEDLMQSNVHRIIITVLTILALVGNLTSFIYRTVLDKRTQQSGFGIFVIHLCVADFLMGIYLMIIGLADHAYKDIYLWNDLTWRHSTICRLAGFLSLWSSEVSAFLICTITVDRFLVLQFPFSQFHFAPKSAHLASTIIWSAGAALAATPLLPVTSHWEFYSQTGICIPLPFSKTDFPGHYYSFSVLVGLNFILFIFIAAGQVFIYWSVTSNSMGASGSTGKSKDQIIARRLITVAVSDFACWFPIGVLGMMAVTGTDISAEVSVIMAILVLPLNSALNPFLYTVNVILEHRKKGHEKRLLALLAQLQEDGQ